MVQGAHFKNCGSCFLWSETYWDNLEHQVRKTSTGSVNRCRILENHSQCLPQGNVPLHNEFLYRQPLSTTYKTPDGGGRLRRCSLSG